MLASACRVIATFAIGGEATAQIPETFTNLQVLPKDIPRAQLVQRMREFSFALNVRLEQALGRPL